MVPSAEDLICCWTVWVYEVCMCTCAGLGAGRPAWRARSGAGPTLLIVWVHWIQFSSLIHQAGHVSRVRTSGEGVGRAAEGNCRRGETNLLFVHFYTPCFSQAVFGSHFLTWLREQVDLLVIAAPSAIIRGTRPDAHSACPQVVQSIRLGVLSLLSVCNVMTSSLQAACRLSYIFPLFGATSSIWHVCSQLGPLRKLFFFESTVCASAGAVRANLTSRLCRALIEHLCPPFLPLLRLEFAHINIVYHGKIQKDIFWKFLLFLV